MIYQPYSLQDQTCWAVKRNNIDYKHLPVLLKNVIAATAVPVQPMIMCDFYICDRHLKEYYRLIKSYRQFNGICQIENLQLNELERRLERNETECKSQPSTSSHEWQRIKLLEKKPTKCV